MKTLFTLLLITSLTALLPNSARCQCENFYTRTYNNYVVYPYSFNADITNNGGPTNLRIRTFRNGTGNKVIMDNPDLLSTIRYGGEGDIFYSHNMCGFYIGNTSEWADFGLLADSSNPTIHTGTSYISIRLSVNGVYKYGWLKIGITPTADTVFVYSLMIDQTTTSPSFKIGQCDNTWPTVCTTTDIGDMNPSVTYAKVYPNPATNLLFLETNGVHVVGVNIFDAAGCLLYEVKDLQTSSIDITDLSVGIYYAEVILTTGSERIRFVKM